MEVPFTDLVSTYGEISAELDAAWSEVTATSAFVGGRFVERFEADWARYCGTAHAVGVANGTDALQLALHGLGIGPGDEVIVPANTFVATPEAVIAVGATPVFVDVDPDTLLVTAAHVAAALTPRSAAVIPVHLFGQPVDMDSVMDVARRAGVAVVEDAAQAHGATWAGRRVGGFGDAACFSFYPSKNLGAFGDGGAVVTNDAKLASAIRVVGNHGRSLKDGRHRAVGMNSRLDGLQAAVLSAKLRRLDDWNTARRRAADLYRTELAGLPLRVVEVADGAEPVYHLEVIRVSRRDELRQHLASAGIGTGIHYPLPCHLEDAFMRAGQPPLPISEAAATEILSLPMHPHLTAADVKTVAAAVNEGLLALA